MPRSVSICTNSSAYRGLPPLRSIRLAWVSAGSTARSSSAAIKLAVSPSDSGRQQDRGAAGHRCSPVGTSIEQLGPRRAQDEHGRVAVLSRQVLDELQHRVVGPVQVLDHQDERATLGERLQVAGPRPEALFARRIVVAFAQPQERGEPRPQPPALLLVGDGGVDGGVQGRAGFDRVVVVHDAGLGLDGFGQCPEAHAFAVGQASALPPPDQIGELFDVVGEVADQPRLADARLAHHGHELQGAVDLVGRPGRRADPAEQLAQRGRLVRSTHERGVATMGFLPGPGLGFDRTPGFDRASAARALHRGELLVAHDMARGPMRRLAHDRPARRRHRLEQRGRVHDVTGDALADLGTHAVGHDGFPGVDTDADRERFVPAIGPLVLDGLLDRAGGQHRSQRIVLVGDRRAEHGHDRVADELVDGAVVVLHHPLDRGVEGAERGVHIFGVGPVGSSCESDEIAEDHGDQPAFLTRGRRQRCSAVQAEPGVGRVLLTAPGTGDHDCESTGASRPRGPAR